jgi:hypothetical protein
MFVLPTLSVGSAYVSAKSKFSTCKNEKGAKLLSFVLLCVLPVDNKVVILSKNKNYGV